MSKPLPPPPAAPTSRAKTAAANPVSDRVFGIKSGVTKAAHKIVIYGPGGVGKSELASHLDQVEIHPLFFDLEQGTEFLDVDRVQGIESYGDLLTALRSETLCEAAGAVVVDSGTKAEEMALAYTLETVAHEKGHYVNSIEGYGYGKGFTHVYESFLLLLQELDRHARAGRHVVMICHDSTEKVPNPAGEDWLQYQPRLQSPPKYGKTRERVKEWCDHLLYIGFDVSVNRDGKGTGGGSRTIYTAETPTAWAKSRSLPETPIIYEKGSADIWRQMFDK